MDFFFVWFIGFSLTFKGYLIQTDTFLICVTKYICINSPIRAFRNEWYHAQNCWLPNIVKFLFSHTTEEIKKEKKRKSFNQNRFSNIFISCFYLPWNNSNNELDTTRDTRTYKVSTDQHQIFIELTFVYFTWYCKVGCFLISLALLSHICLH